MGVGLRRRKRVRRSGLEGSWSGGAVVRTSLSCWRRESGESVVEMRGAEWREEEEEGVGERGFGRGRRERIDSGRRQGRVHGAVGRVRGAWGWKVRGYGNGFMGREESRDGGERTEEALRFGCGRRWSGRCTH